MIREVTAMACGGKMKKKFVEEYGPKKGVRVFYAWKKKHKKR
jgi:hypothetical protein